MIIWGSTSKNVRLEEGDFFCPRCKSKQEYELIAVKSYFTLYFIPLFATSTLGTYVECIECEGQFDEEILDIPTQELMAATKPWVCQACQNKNPAGESECLDCGASRA